MVPSRSPPVPGCREGGGWPTPWPWPDSLWLSTARGCTAGRRTARRAPYRAESGALKVAVRPRPTRRTIRYCALRGFIRQRAVLLKEAHLPIAGRSPSSEASRQPARPRDDQIRGSMPLNSNHDLPASEEHLNPCLHGVIARIDTDDRRVVLVYEAERFPVNENLVPNQPIFVEAACSAATSLVPASRRPPRVNPTSGVQYPAVPTPG